MIYCERTNCEYNENETCLCEEVSIDKEGTCTDYKMKFEEYWEMLDDIEREELMEGKE